jgi:hypothetical protein
MNTEISFTFICLPPFICFSYIFHISFYTLMNISVRIYIHVYTCITHTQYIIGSLEHTYIYIRINICYLLTRVCVLIPMYLSIYIYIYSSVYNINIQFSHLVLSVVTVTRTSTVRYYCASIIPILLGDNRII